MHHSVILLLVLGTLLSTSTQDQTYDNFRKQHVNVGMTEDQCDDVIRERIITRPRNLACKKQNDFILANPDDVKGVCTVSGTEVNKKPGFYKSKKPFNAIICELISGTTYPDCLYEGRFTIQNIVVLCKKNLTEYLPVHLDELVRNRNG